MRKRDNVRYGVSNKDFWIRLISKPTAIVAKVESTKSIMKTSSSLTKESLNLFSQLPAIS